MKEPNSTPDPKFPSLIPTGLWKLLCIIAERIPHEHLLWFTLLILLFTLAAGWMGCTGVNRDIESKSITTLVGTISTHTTEKMGKAP